MNFENLFIIVFTTTGLTANIGFLLQIDYIYMSDFKSLGVDITELMARFG